MTIPAIPPISALSGVTPTTTPIDPSASTSATSGTDFAQALGKGLDQVQAVQSNADSLAVQAATGNLTDISQYTVAASQASLVTQLTSALRTQAIGSFNEIMGMQA
jgi:flagellar hook-basal body complex protein FliE